MCFSASRGLWLLWKWVIFRVSLAQAVPTSALVTSLLSPHLMHLSPDWKWRKGGGQGAVTKQQGGSILLVSGSVNGFSVWRHWGILDEQSSESRKVFRREAEGEGNVGIQLVLFQKLYLCWTWYRLWLSWDLPKAPKYLGVGLSMVKPYLRLSYPTYCLLLSTLCCKHLQMKCP